MSDMLDTIRRRLGVTGHEPYRRRAVEQRIAARDAPPPPGRVLQAHNRLIADFRARLEAQFATTDHVASAAALPEAIRRYLQAAALPAQMVAAPALADAFAHADSAGLTLRYGAPGDTDRVGLARAALGIAETGSLVFVSAPDMPVSLCYVPEVQIALIRAADIAGPLEAAWRLQRRLGDDPPRSLCFVSGPSRTADIEQTMFLGAHGPAKLHVIIYDDAAFDSDSETSAPDRPDRS